MRVAQESSSSASINAHAATRSSNAEQPKQSCVPALTAIAIPSANVAAWPCRVLIEVMLSQQSLTTLAVELSCWRSSPCSSCLLAQLGVPLKSVNAHITASASAPFCASGKSCIPYGS